MEKQNTDNEEQDLTKQMQKYKPLRKELAKALDLTIKDQANRLEKIVKNQWFSTADCPGVAELLVHAGLIECTGDYGSLMHASYEYKATAKGLEVYQLLKEGLK